MKVFYSYKNELFEDIRDIVENNKLETNWRYIFQEYLPYQIFISGQTFFTGVHIVPNARYDIADQHENFIKLEEVFEQYMEGRRYPLGNFTAAVSGGTDSSIVALLTKPDYIYTGYYDDPACDERRYAEEVSGKLKCEHVQVEITESGYIEKVDEFLRAICTPIAGMGGIAEYLALNQVVKTHNPDTVFFGNGGDEIFCGYHYNQLLHEMVLMAEGKHIWMENFAPARKRFIYDNLNTFINMYNYRGKGSPTSNPFTELKGDYIDRMLAVNINYTLPSLLHLNQQMCRAHYVVGNNPLSSEILIKHAKDLNTPFSTMPKMRLKHMVDLPAKIRMRRDKMGFPIPVDKWNELDRIMRESYDWYAKDLRKTEEPYDGINRRTWGIFMIERWSRIFG